MKVTVERVANVKRGNRAYCIGHLSIDNVYYCDTIEDIDRGLDQALGDDNKKLKVASKTAIPVGTYKVSMSRYSPKFGQKIYYKKLCGGNVPYLNKVPAFEGILMHCGKDETSSAGCIILGYNTVVGRVTNSTQAFEKVYKKMKSAEDTITITITRKYKV